MQIYDREYIDYTNALRKRRFSTCSTLYTCQVFFPPKYYF